MKKIRFRNRLEKREASTFRRSETKPNSLSSPSMSQGENLETEHSSILF